ncbi:hypothetical protein HK101_007678 [Irineochytrium annulatum]|nr:hypothetical protein HK101_007678 [Irineochytrium annulatum]
MVDIDHRHEQEQQDQCRGEALDHVASESDAESEASAVMGIHRRVLTDDQLSEEDWATGIAYGADRNAEPSPAATSPVYQRLEGATWAHDHQHEQDQQQRQFWRQDVSLDSEWDADTAVNDDDDEEGDAGHHSRAEGWARSILRRASGSLDFPPMRWGAGLNQRRASVGSPGFGVGGLLEGAVAGTSAPLQAFVQSSATPPQPVPVRASSTSSVGGLCPDALPVLTKIVLPHDCGWDATFPVARPMLGWSFTGGGGSYGAYPPPSPSSSSSLSGLETIAEDKEGELTDLDGEGDGDDGDARRPGHGLAVACGGRRWSFGDAKYLRQMSSSSKSPSVRLPSDWTSPESYAAAVVEFLPRFQWLWSLHAYDVLRDDFFTTTFPEDWRFLAGDLSVDADRDNGYDLDALIGLARGVVKESWPESLKEYVRMCGRMTLPRDFDGGEWEGLLTEEMGRGIDISDTTNAAMSKKKLHEVERLTRLVLEVARRSGADAIVDVGAGQGYLTHRLAEALPVIALDFNEIQTVGSKERGEMLERNKERKVKAKGKGKGKRKGKAPAAAQDATQEADGEVIADVDAAPADDAGTGATSTAATSNITYFTDFINTDKLSTLLDRLASLPQSHTSTTNTTASSPQRRLLLVGLHACGDLSSTTMLHAYAHTPSVVGLVVVPCCYNLLTEPCACPGPAPSPSTSSNECAAPASAPGFPLSSHVSRLCTSHNVTLGHRGRNLACQTLTRFSTPQLLDALQGHHRRSLLDAILPALNLTPTTAKTVKVQAPDGSTYTRFKVGRLSKKAYEGGIVEYMMEALPRLGCEGVKEEDVRAVAESARFRGAERKVAVVFFVRSLLAGVVEGLLLVDRLIYLHERETEGDWGPKGGMESRLLNLFDFQESPRNMVLVSEKVKS